MRVVPAVVLTYLQEQGGGLEPDFGGTRAKLSSGLAWLLQL